MKNLLFLLTTLAGFIVTNAQAIILSCKLPQDGAKEVMYRSRPYEGQKREGYIVPEPVDSHVFWDQSEVMCEVKPKSSKESNAQVKAKQYAILHLLGVGPGFNINFSMGYKLYCPGVSNLALISNKVLLGAGINAAAIVSARIGAYSTVNSPIQSKCFLVGVGIGFVGAGVSINGIMILPVNPKDVIVE